MRTPFAMFTPTRVLCLAALCCSWLLLNTGTQASENGPAARRAPIPLITIGARGQIKLDGRPAGTVKRTATLTTRLAKVLRRRAGKSSFGPTSTQETGGTPVGGSDRAVIVMAPAATRYEVLNRVVKAAQRAGAGPIRLVSNSAELRRARRELASAPDAWTRDTPAPPGDSTELRDPSADPNILKDSSIIVAIAPDGELYVQSQLVTRDKLEAAVRSLTDKLPEAERSVYVRSHIDARYELVVEVIETIRRAGVSRIGLVADRRAPK